MGVALSEEGVTNMEFVGREAATPRPVPWSEVALMDMGSTPPSPRPPPPPGGGGFIANRRPDSRCAFSDAFYFFNFLRTRFFKISVFQNDRIVDGQG